ncbi:hypothetical protein [Poritiphilus flavus]|uniref:Uncharacterized protein n=1 Tax=Poritiphilus flavus TaxID=2697053 RepID=A0A6L9E8K7_9FLAO|nr:hypothetical protein [Poritiphilus flavus]NAS10941.1 hypothetical protein [Poritiphilus flavus]
MSRFFKEKRQQEYHSQDHFQQCKYEENPQHILRLNLAVIPQCSIDPKSHGRIEAIDGPKRKIKFPAEELEKDIVVNGKQYQRKQNETH